VLCGFTFWVSRYAGAKIEEDLGCGTNQLRNAELDFVDAKVVGLGPAPFGTGHCRAHGGGRQKFVSAERSRDHNKRYRSEGDDHIMDL